MKQILNNKKFVMSLVNILLLIYFIASLLTLTRFPFMHSDESWLSGLTRTMMNEGISSTETFFDLLPRYPHALKTIFHLIQMPFISMLGYNLFSVRLVSLIFGCAALLATYKIVFKITKSKTVSFMSVGIMALDVQFIYASHFARQEIIVAFGILLIYLYIIKNIQTWSYIKDILIAVIIGAMIGIHPNAFIVSLVAASIYLYYLLIDKKIKIHNILVLIVVTAGFAGVFVGISYLFDPQFISHYLKYGDHLGVTMTFAQKIRALAPFYQKLWLGISGTYYTPWIKVQIVIFFAAIVSGSVYAFFDKKVLMYLFPIVAVNAGYIIIGRYSQPSILLMFIVCWLLVFFLVSRLKKFKIALLSVVAVLMLVVSAVQIAPNMNHDYKDYLQDIKRAVPENAKVLANLNSEYAFAYNSLLDYRNLGYIDESGMDFADYVKSNEIEYIIYPEEMDYIYQVRPVWNIVYGNLYPYYEDMKTFIDENCELVDEFYSPYAMRIAKLAYEKEWKVKIYKVTK